MASIEKTSSLLRWNSPQLSIATENFRINSAQRRYQQAESAKNAKPLLGVTLLQIPSPKLVRLLFKGWGGDRYQVIFSANKHLLKGESSETGNVKGGQFSFKRSI
jgi:hypothetical protein